MRPNDLVWNYWVNNYLLGDEPPKFDVLYWNNDTTRLPAALHSDYLDLFLHNPLPRPGGVKLLGTAIDLGKVGCDSFIVAGTTDHITPWHACYATAAMLGGKNEFVLSSSGHIQSIINPPGNAKAKFFRSRNLPRDPEAWLATAEPQAGSWWDYWRDWICARSGAKRPAPASLGSNRHPPGVQAPGRYVFEA
jgi:polyhydroxyalkanoate synthase